MRLRLCLLCKPLTCYPRRNNCEDCYLRLNNLSDCWQNKLFFSVVQLSRPANLLRTSSSRRPSEGSYTAGFWRPFVGSGP